MSTDLAVIEAALKAATPGPWDEEWRAIPGYSLYEVSDQGKVRSWRAQTRKAGANPRAESPHLMVLRNSRRDGRGYQSVSLPTSGKYANVTVHRLVMLAFVGPRPDGLEVAHLNGDSTDNRLLNLRYVTHQENESHKLLHATKPTGEAVNGARLLGWQVAEIRYLASKGITQAKIASLFDMTSGHVSDVLRGKIWAETVARDTGSPSWLAELVERVKVDEAAIERVWRFANNARRDYAHISGCGGDPECPACWAHDILRALDGDAKRCTSDITLRDEEHRLCRCTLTGGHAGVHDDGAGTTWTGGDA